MIVSYCLNDQLGIEIIFEEGCKKSGIFATNIVERADEGAGLLRADVFLCER